MEVGFFALPVQLGKEGIEKILPLPKLNTFEEAKLRDMMPTLKSNIEKGVTFITQAKV